MNERSRVRRIAEDAQRIDHVLGLIQQGAGTKEEIAHGRKEIEGLWEGIRIQVESTQSFPWAPFIIGLVIGLMFGYSAS